MRSIGVCDEVESRPHAPLPSPGPYPREPHGQAELGRLRRGEEDAFVLLLRRYHGRLLRWATARVGSRAVAEEVVQETWLGLVQSLGRFQGRSSLETWIFRILSHKIKSFSHRERRHIVVADLHMLPTAYAAATCPIATPEQHLFMKEVRLHLVRAVQALPPGLRTVFILRDIQGRSAKEVCLRLGIRDTHQRVLLHRARTRVRRALALHGYRR